MATTFYFPATGSGTPTVSPAFTAGWEQTGQAVRLKLLDKARLDATTSLADSPAVTVPITTSQDILGFQFVSSPLAATRIMAGSATALQFVVRCSMNASTTVVQLAMVVKVVSNDGLTVRGTLFTSFGSGTVFSLTGADSTRKNSGSVTAVTTQSGDRLVVELGATATSPSVAGSYLMRFGDSASSDFAYTASLTTDLNPSIQFEQTLYQDGTGSNNFQFVKVGDGMSVSEKIR